MSSTKLAIDGGSPVRTGPMPPRRLFGEEEKQAAVALFDASIRTGEAFGYGGAEEKAFEAEFAEALGGGFADGVNGGTTAVFAALGALQLEAGSEVVVPPITDPGGVMPAVMLNLVPVFADADPRTYNMSAESLAAAVTPRTRAVLVAHIAGEPADMDGILAVARKHGLKVVEDCAQAHGTRYKGRLAGTLGDIAAFSTMSGKHMATAAQGGVVFTRNEQLHWNGRRFADRGKPFGITPPAGNVMAGLNLNLNDLSAAVGRVQLRKRASVIERRHAGGEAVKAGLAALGCGVALGWQQPESYCSYWFLRLSFDAARFTVPKERFCQALGAEGIPSIPTYRHIQCEGPWFRERLTNWCPWFFRDKIAREPQLPNAVTAAASHFNIMFHENMGGQEIRDIVEAVGKVAAAYGKG
jgi:dTDP-4-amino-4,6-dideoxygalactose transaminase